MLLPIIHSQQKYHIFICFDVFSAYYNNNSSISPSKNNSTESHILLEPIQIPPAINRISLPSQSTAPEESLAPIFVASEQGLDTSVYKRVFKPPRLKSQIYGLDSLRGRLPCLRQIPIFPVYMLPKVNKLVPSG